MSAAPRRHMVVLTDAHVHELQKLCEERRLLLQEEADKYPDAQWPKLELKQLRQIWQAFDRKARIYD